MAAHAHDFLGAAHDRNARRTRWVVMLSAVMTVAEIIAGTLTGSMALVADGWHMATHTLALGVSALAYSFARKRSTDAAYSWGTGKVGSLAGFASALGLAAVAVGILVESAGRFVEPRTVDYREALAVAVVGLLVNLASALLLGHGHDHGDDHGHGHDHHDHDHHGHAHHHDHNLRSAYLHVLADALTSVLAIAALAAGWFYGWRWLDPAVAIVGAVVILHWSRGLVAETAAVLLDRVPDPALSAELKRRVEGDGEVTVSDWHLWTVGPGRYAAIVSARGAPASEIRRRLGADPRIAHVTVECE
ncbi:CDF family Co(II)/Ni(II) efflux transporter DmeF [Sphingomonas sp. LHG3406-1]|uniref:CDF family Co(II)/Ni(II) efflux transporter DmeF n=1 Tax=Sphingomonas sp. LHG3406-1 TaxID=2804617 RepID=UPI0026216864|nr:CDF family Co(II)/Ni(II) efflux transporter DmeF [Sphingomonas sp. LHG3406-1]